VALQGLGIDHRGRYAVPGPLARERLGATRPEGVVEGGLVGPREEVIWEQVPEEPAHPIRPVAKAVRARCAAEGVPDAVVAQRMQKPDIGVPSEQLEARGPNAKRAKAAPEAHARLHALRLPRLRRGQRPRYRALSRCPKPWEGHGVPPRQHSFAQDGGREDPGRPERIGAPRARAAGQHGGQAAALGGAEQLVATDPRQQRAAAGKVEQGQMEVHVEGPEQAMAAEHALGVGPDGVEVVGVLAALPRSEPKVAHERLLPARLVGEGSAADPVRDGNRICQPVAPREVRGRGQHQ
jgi:hypothetical protein